MTACEEMFCKMNKKVAVLLQSIPKEYEKTSDWLKRYREELRSQMEQLQSEKYNNVPILPKTPSRYRRTKEPVQSCTSDEEKNTTKNNSKADTTDSSISNNGRSRRNASKLAGQKIAIQSQQTLKKKLRQPSKDDTALNDISNNTAILNIKAEKKSESPAKEPTSKIDLDPEVENIKKENMPPPAAKPKKTRKRIKKEVDSSDTENESVRSTRSKKAATKSSAAKTTKKTKSHKDSDVILQEIPVPIVIIDSEKEDTATQPSATDSDDEVLASRIEKSKPKKPAAKTKKTTKKNVTSNESVYEDALPTLPTTNNEIKECRVSVQNMQKNDALNITRVIEKPSLILNETRVLSKDEELKDIARQSNCIVMLEKLDENVSKKINETVTLTPKENGHWEKAIALPTNDSLLTEDESIVAATPEKKPEPPRKKIKTKQIFSPYGNSPVRNRVAAFEKLVNSADEPTRMTRTKTRNLEKNNIESSTGKAKTKYFTPVANNKIPSLIPQTDTKLCRTVAASKHNLTAKSASAMKPTKTELQQKREEEQKKRIEREEEVKRKREALMLAKAEEQRKKREEKQMKAQKLREEIEREKEEKLRQQLQEKEEERQRRLEWQAKKQAEIEERKRAEAENLKLQYQLEQEKLRQMEQKRKKQLAASKPPPLAVDYEDSDSDSESTASKKNAYEKPDWAQRANKYQVLKTQLRVPKSFIVDFFQMGAQTPDLREIFDTSDERLLRRNSSAVWRTPPRYSTLPKY